MDIQSFKAAVGKFPTGVCVITTALEDKLFGFTANSFVSVSLSPPLISFCLDKKAFSLHAFSQSKHFAISILSSQQSPIASKFALSGENKFKDTQYNLSKDKIPLISDSTSQIECIKYNEIDCGDHIIFIGEVTKVKIDNEAQPLIYYGKNYRYLTNE